MYYSYVSHCSVIILIVVIANTLVFLFCRHQTEIENICSSAGRELELEVRMRNTEEEWTEQV